MGKHSIDKPRNNRDKADQDSGNFSGDLFSTTPDVDKPTRTFESDNGGVQGIEYT